MSTRASSPYRDAAPPNPLAPPPAELAYTPGDKPRRAAAARRAAVGFWLGASASGFVAIVSAQPALGAGLFVALVGAIAWSWRRGAAGKRIVLRIDEGRLVSSGAATGDVDEVSIPLAKIRNVRLETKTIEKLAADRVVGAYVASSSVRPAFDVSRIVIVPSKSWGAPFVLDAEFHPSFEAVEWLGKLRRFLRAYGWIPADERPPKGASGDARS